MPSSYLQTLTVLLAVAGVGVVVEYNHFHPRTDPTLKHLSATFADFSSEFTDFAKSQRSFGEGAMKKADKLQVQVTAALDKMNEPVSVAYHPLTVHVVPIEPLVQLRSEAFAQALAQIANSAEEQKCVLHGAMTEVSNQDDVGVANYFQVVVNRMTVDRSDWGGRNACGVVHQINRDKNTGKMVRQFSGVTVSEVHWNPQETSDLVRMKVLLHSYLARELKVPEAYLRSDSYMNPCTADHSNVRDWRKSLLFDGRHEDHDFYHTPSLQEIGMLRSQLIPAPVCKGHGHVRLMARAHHHRYRHRHHAPMVAKQPSLLQRLFASMKSSKPKQVAEK